MNRQEIWDLIRDDYDNKRFFNAYTAVANLVIENSQDKNLLYMQAFLAQKMNWHSVTIGYCNEVLKIEPENIEALKTKLISCEKLNYCEESFKVHNQILKIIPNDPYSLLGKAKYLFRNSKFDECNKVCTRLINIDTEDVNLLEPILNFFEIFLRKRKEIVMICDKILKIDNRNIQVYTKKAFALLSIHEYKRAIKTCNEILLLDNSNAMAYLIKMNALEALGRYREVLKICDKLLTKFNSNNITVLPVKAAMFTYLKDYANSKITYEKIISLCEKQLARVPDNKQLAETCDNAKIQLNILKINSNRKLTIQESFDFLCRYLLISLLQIL